MIKKIKPNSNMKMRAKHFKENMMEVELIRRG